MIEYLYNAIRATAGEDICICASITDDDGKELKDCVSHISLFDGDTLLEKIPGVYAECWEYHIPADITKNLKGRYWYCICVDNSTLQFKQPIYLI